MPDRQYSAANSYRYGFNGKESDNEVKGNGNSLDFGARIYDPRISRWLSIDPLTSKYASQSPYIFSHNSPIAVNDPDGMDGVVTISGNTITVTTKIYIWGKDATSTAASRIQSSIMNSWAKQSNGSSWTYTDPTSKTVYTVKFDVSVELYNGKEKQNPFIIPGAWDPTNTNNYIEVDDGYSRSFVKGGDEGIWSSTKNGGWTSAHEWGHLVGLDDRYTDGSGGSIPDAGWSGNIMASVNGLVDQKNIDGIVKGHVDNFNVQKSDAKKRKEAYDKLPISVLIGTGDGIPPPRPISIPTEYKGIIDIDNPKN